MTDEYAIRNPAAVIAVLNWMHHRDDLEPRERTLLHTLAGETNDRDEIWAGNGRLIKLSGLSLTTLNREKKDLEGKGLIEITERSKTSNRVVLSAEVFQPVQNEQGVQSEHVDAILGNSRIEVKEEIHKRPLTLDVQYEHPDPIQFTAAGYRRGFTDAAIQAAREKAKYPESVEIAKATATVSDSVTPQIKKPFRSRRRTEMPRAPELPDATKELLQPLTDRIIDTLVTFGSKKAKFADQDKKDDHWYYVTYRLMLGEESRGFRDEVLTPDDERWQIVLDDAVCEMTKRIHTVLPHDQSIRRELEAARDRYAIANPVGIPEPQLPPAPKAKPVEHQHYGMSVDDFIGSDDQDEDVAAETAKLAAEWTERGEKIKAERQELMELAGIPDLTAR